MCAKGIWRKCTLESFRAGSPKWSTVIDFDALPPPKVDSAKTWVWHGSTLLDEGPGEFVAANGGERSAHGDTGRARTIDCM